MPEIYDFTVNDIRGHSVSLDAYRGKVLLIVNTASQCGLTPQYKGLESLYRDYRDKGLEILAFPCNQFGGQEPGSAEEISGFCEANYGISFPLFAKIDVNGKETAPLYQYLKEQAPGLLGSQRIKWNFTKFLVDRDGRVIKRFAPTDAPRVIEQELAALLAPEQQPEMEPPAE